MSERGEVARRKLGPNMKKLIVHKLSIDAIPDGGGFNAGVKFLMTPGALADGWKKAAEWCDAAIEVIRLAAEPNPWKEASEEAIAGHLLQRIEERKAKR
jgi:hypothetical protein